MTVQRRNFILKILTAVIVAAVVAVFFVTRGDSSDNSSKYEGYDLTVSGISRSNTYVKYLAKHKDAAEPDASVEIGVLSYDKEKSYGVSDNSSMEGAEAVITEDKSYIEYAFNVSEAGMYNIYMEYYQVESKSNDIERRIYINGEMPFIGADALTFRRVWTDKSKEIKKDNQGNQIRSSQIEAPRWESVYINDYTGYNVDPYKFYFESGENTLALEARNEPMAIGRIVIVPVKEYKSYSEYLSGYDLELYQGGDGFHEKIQAESAEYRSSPSLYATYDRSSGTVEPYSVTNTTLNMMGGQSWKIAGQWIEWEFEVPENGMYRISVKARQNYNRGLISNRAVYIDGEIPCEDVRIVEFRYSGEWELATLQNSEGDDLYFPLEKGKHTLRMEVNLGDLGGILTDIEESIYRLNKIYLKVLVVTGAEPDTYRDYRLTDIYPELTSDMEFESRVLFKIIDDIVAYTGKMGSEASSLQTIANQLERFVSYPQDIPKSMVSFKDNIAALGNALAGLPNSQLDLDYLIVSGKDVELPKLNEGFLISAAHEIKSFAASFFVDYNTLGDIYMDNEAIDVWMLSGRDQSTILKTMIDDDYTPATNNLVNVKLVAGDTLMPAVVTGTGPDVVLTVGNGEPMNYAIRKACINLSEFEGFEEVISEYSPSSIVPYRYNGGVYGLPETINFNVMFYREDILEDLGVEIPQTWDDLVKIIPIIQKQNMSVGIPSVERKINDVLNPDLSNFFCHLYQNGGALYSEDGSETLLDSEEAVRAFENYTKLFTHYKSPLFYDFVNRFRTGEMPLGFVDYNTYNTLAVFAPEIRGLWSFTILPGTVEKDGTVNRSTSMWGQASMMLANNSNEFKSWEFLKWWSGSSAQIRYGREIEAALGSSARYTTANRVAFESLSWSTDEADILREQWDWVVGTPEVPGGYYTGRYIINAVRRVINKSEDTRETLLDYTRTINEELTKKRKEFNIE